MRNALLAASAIEAFFLLMMTGYGPLYLHQAFHASDVVASLASAGPALATFLGSTVWGHRLRRQGISAVARIGLVAYLFTALVAVSARSAVFYIVGVTACTLLSSALAPATLTLLTFEGGNMGSRLATRLKWQSSGWMVGGLVGGYLVSLSPRAFVLVLAGLALFMTIPLFGLASQPLLTTIPTDPLIPRPPRQLGLMILLVLPFFLAYAGNEGFFTNFGLYLNGMHVPTDWVGWSAAISTGFGWMLASRIGTWADRSGGKELLLRVLLGYTVMYLVMALAHSQIVVIIAFSLPLYPLLNIGVQRALAESLPGEWHGGAMGLINGSAGLATFGGSIIMGTMITVFGPGGMPWAAVIFVGLGLLLAFVLYRRPRLSGVKNVRG